MLHYHEGLFNEGLHALPGGVGVGDVVIRKFLPLNLGIAGDAAGNGIAVAVESRRLVRVLAIAEVLYFCELERETRGERGRLAVAREGREVIGDGGLVRRAVGERVLCQSKASVFAQGPAAF